MRDLDSRFSRMWQPLITSIEDEKAMLDRLEHQIASYQIAVTKLRATFPVIFDQLPDLTAQLEPAPAALLWQAIDQIVHSAPNHTARQERKLAADLEMQLHGDGVPQPREAAARLVRAGLTDDVPGYYPLLRHPQAALMLGVMGEIGGALKRLGALSSSLTLALDNITEVKYFLYQQYFEQAERRNPIEVQVADKIDLVLRLCDHSLQQGVQVACTFDPTPSILGYPEDLTRLWTTLILNAAHALNFRGDIAIAVRHIDATVSVRISDNGPSLLLDEPAAIFNPEHEAHVPALMMCRIIVEKHKGRIRIESEPGRTSFVVEFPVVGESA